MLNRVLKAFWHTEMPYRRNFTERVLLDKVPVLDMAYKTLVERPWVTREMPPMIKGSGHDCHIAAIPHYRTGIGHILAEWNTGLLWSMKLGIPFAHCPLRSPWNDFFGLTGFPDYETLRKTEGMRSVKLPPISETENPAESPLITGIINYYGRKGPTLFHLYYGQNAFRQDETHELLRTKYFARRKIAPMPSVRTDGFLNVSVHVRRPTAEDSANPKFNDPNSAAHKSRYFDIAFFIHICRMIEEAVGAEKVIFNIFSLGSHADFTDFDVLRNVRYHLNTDVLETFHNLVIGDILLVSPSGFSFTAGLISRGIKIAPYPWWHDIPNNSEWCRVGIGPDGDKEVLNRFLQTALSLQHF